MFNKLDASLNSYTTTQLDKIDKTEKLLVEQENDLLVATKLANKIKL